MPAKDLAEARALVARHEVAVAFIHLHGGVDGTQCSGLLLLEDDTLDEVKALFMNEHDSPRLADEAIRKGTGYFFCKPFDPHAPEPIFKDIVQDVLPVSSQESTGEPCAIDQFGFLRGSSRSMRKLYRLLRKVAQTDASLIIVGESGTGKELVAQTVHTLSPRSSGPFVAVNCAAVSETLIESELFGHEKGSFSGAHSRHKGYFEQAHGGTLFLNEITEMDLQLQTRLLRVLETKETHISFTDAALEVVSSKVWPGNAPASPTPASHQPVRRKVSSYTLPLVTPNENGGFVQRGPSPL